MQPASEMDTALLKLKVDKQREVTVNVHLSSSVLELKRVIAKEHTVSSLPDDIGPYLVMAIVSGRQVVLPEQLSVRDALLFAKHGAPSQGQHTEAEIEALYLDKYHVPAAWKVVGFVRYGAALVIAALGRHDCIAKLEHLRLMRTLCCGLCRRTATCGSKQ